MGAVSEHRLRIENTGLERITEKIVVTFNEPLEPLSFRRPEIMVVESRQLDATEGGPTLRLTPKSERDEEILRPPLSVAEGDLDLHPGEYVEVEIMTVVPATDGPPGLATYFGPAGPPAKVRVRGVAIVEAVWGWQNPQPPSLEQRYESAKSQALAYRRSLVIRTGGVVALAFALARPWASWGPSAS